jgi:hypothetical protein
LQRGGNVAVVYPLTPKTPMITRWRLNGRDYQVIDGDLTDYRPDDGHGVIVGLRAKGAARRDQSGFVRAVN